MSGSIGARRAGMHAVARKSQARLRNLAVAVLTAATLVGCMEVATPLVRPDPADPGVKVRGVSYRPTVAPYTSLRPASAVGWKEQNRGVTPAPAKPE